MGKAEARPLEVEAVARAVRAVSEAEIVKRRLQAVDQIRRRSRERWTAQHLGVAARPARD